MNDSVQNSLDYILARLKEPSSWAGIAVFIGMFGLSPDTLTRITTNGPAVITAMATLIAIFAPSHKKTVVVTAESDAGVAALSRIAPAAAAPAPAAEVADTPRPGDSV